MQTDELRAELAELAREVDQFPEELAAIRHRVARRRVATSSIVAVLIVGLIAGVIATTRSGGDRVQVAGHPKQVTITELPRIDALVTLPGQASDADVARVMATLDATGVVRNYARVPRKSVEFLILGKASGSSVVLGVELDRSVVDRLQQLAVAVGSSARVKAFDLPKGRPAYDDVEIFMEVKACEGQIYAVRRAVERDPDVVSFRFLTKEDALREFRRLFSDQPNLIENTTAASLPASFQLRVRDGVLPRTIASRYAQLAGVRFVNTAANPLAGQRQLTPPNEDQSACTSTP
jgi:hypothetical protein